MSQACNSQHVGPQQWTISTDGAVLPPIAEVLSQHRCHQSVWTALEVLSGGIPIRGIDDSQIDNREDDVVFFCPGHAQNWPLAYCVLDLTPQEESAIDAGVPDAVISIINQALQECLHTLFTVTPSLASRRLSDRVVRACHDEMLALLSHYAKAMLTQSSTA